ncbi:MAG: efflux RND transporter periplasmic adaptor subunit [Thermomonas sp.]
MKSIRVLVVVAILGAVIALVSVIHSNRSAPKRSPPIASPQAPFASYVAGSGITETGRGNVVIGASVTGVVREIDVQVGDRVAAGDPLFRIDDRDLQAKLHVAQAGASQAQAALEKPTHRLGYLNRLQRLDPGVISREMITNAVDDAELARTELVSAKAVAAQLQVENDRLVVRAPIKGRVLQVNTRVGEFADSSLATKPLMLVGDDTRIYLRVDIDENDAWRVRANELARAYVRGNSKLSIPLRFEYIEPFLVPKTSLTGQSTERSDLRVLQVVYSFERGNLPVYVGQQMDAFIQAPAVVTDGHPGPH